MKNKQETLNSELIQIRDIITDKLTAAEAEIQKYTDMLQQEKNKADQAGAKIDADIDKADQPGYRKHIDEKKNAEIKKNDRKICRMLSMKASQKKNSDRLSIQFQNVLNE